MLEVNVTVGNHQGQDHPYASRAADSRAPTRAQATLHRGEDRVAGSGDRQCATRWLSWAALGEPEAPSSA